MKSLVFLALTLLACQRHDDTPTTSTTTSASTIESATPPASVSAATLEPLMTASAAPTTSQAAVADAAPSANDARKAELAKQEQMQLQLLQALGSGPPTQGVLKSTSPDFAPLDIGDAGLQLRSGGGGPIRPGHRGGLGDLGARDH